MSLAKQNLWSNKNSIQFNSIQDISSESWSALEIKGIGYATISLRIGFTKFVIVQCVPKISAGLTF